MTKNALEMQSSAAQTIIGQLEGLHSREQVGRTSLSVSILVGVIWLLLEVRNNGSQKEVSFVAT